MTIAKTDTRENNAKRLRFMPGVGLISTNVEDAVLEVAGNATIANTQPPAIAATTVNFAQSPYTVLGTDFILEVDTTGGVVVITPQAVATRTKPLQIKDVLLNAGTNNIQITGPIEGFNPYLINADGESITIRPNKAKTAYEVVSW